LRKVQNLKMSMQLSDEELLDDSQLKMTVQDSSIERNM